MRDSEIEKNTVKHRGSIVMPNKQKKEVEEKLRIIHKYLKGEISLSEGAREGEVDFQSFKRWVNIYENNGIDGFVYQNNRHYSAEEKSAAVIDYLHGGGSLQTVCKKHNIKFNENKKGLFSKDDYLNAPKNIVENLHDELVEFDSSKATKELYNSMKPFKIGTRIFATVLIMIYFDAFMGLIAANLLKTSSLLPNICAYAIAGLILVFTIACFIYIGKIKKTKRKVFQMREEKIAKLVTNTKKFKELARITYQNPEELKELSEEEAEIEQQIEEKHEEEVEAIEEVEEESIEELQEKQLSYENSFNVDTVVIDEFENEPNLTELVDNMRHYFEYRGMVVEYATLRNLVASMASSKIIFLRSDEKELISQFIPLLTSYFHSKTTTVAEDTWSEPKNLYWREDGGRYIPTHFVNNLKANSDNEKLLTINVIENVSMNNFEAYFKDIIKHCLLGREKSVISLNDDLKVDLFKNQFFIIVPKNRYELENMSTKIAGISNTVDIQISKTRENETYEKVDVKPLSSRYFAQQIKDSRKSLYIKEDTWKKIDEFEELFNKQIFEAVYQKFKSEFDKRDNWVNYIVEE